MLATTTLKRSECVKKRKAFVADALAAEKEVEQSGLVYRAADVHRYIRALARGKKARRPKSVKR